MLLRLARNMARLGIVSVDLHSHTFDEARMKKWAYYAHASGQQRRYWLNLLCSLVLISQACQSLNLVSPPRLTLNDQLHGHAVSI